MKYANIHMQRVSMTDYLYWYHHSLVLLDINSESPTFVTLLTQPTQKIITQHQSQILTVHRDSKYIFFPPICHTAFGEYGSF